MYATCVSTYNTHMCNNVCDKETQYLACISPTRNENETVKSRNINCTESLDTYFRHQSKTEVDDGSLNRYFKYQSKT